MHPVHAPFSDPLSSAAARPVTTSPADGHPLLKATLLHAAAGAAAGVIIAPRLTAAATLGALLKGVTLSLDEPGDAPATARSVRTGPAPRAGRRPDHPA